MANLQAFPPATVLRLVFDPAALRFEEFCLTHPKARRVFFGLFSSASPHTKNSSPNPSEAG